MTNNEIRDFLQNAIDENSVMLFMKGTPQQPACGFSARTSARAPGIACSIRRCSSSAEGIRLQGSGRYTL